MVVALRLSPPVKGKPPKLNMLELVTEVNSRYRQNKLRRRLLPHAYCYVCSRIDPSGVFRNPNSYLFRKGFFQACEHFPKAPYTTFVRDDIKGHPSDESRTGKTTESSPLVAPSISVTIKQSPGMVSQYGSPIRRERTFGSSVEKRSAANISRSLDESELAGQKETENTPHLPPISNKSRASLKHRSISNALSRSDRLTDNASRRRVKESFQTSEQTYSTTEKVETTPSVTVIPYGQGGDADSEIQSKITELSTFTKGTTPSKSTNDLDSKPLTTANVTSTYTARTDPSSDLDQVLQTRPFINESDGLDIAYGLDPLVRDTASLESYVIKAPQRPKAGRARDRVNIHQDESVSSARPESGHLRYHHRLEDDTVPDPGFEIPPSPSEEDILSLTTSERERQEEERNIIEQQIAEGNVFLQSSSGLVESSISDDASLRLSEVTSRTKAQSEIPTMSGKSGKRSFCRCTTDIRAEVASENACQTCGKPLRHGSSECTGGSSMTRSGNYGVPPTSQGSLSTKSRQNMLYDSRRIKTVTDEDYMDLDSIIHEDDGHYFSSDEDNFPHHFDNSPETFERYRKIRTKPIADPNLHKIVYLRALREAQLRKFDQEFGELYEDEELPNRRHQQTFSYFQLLPHAENRTEVIGLRPPENVKVKKGQFMKHIFGDVNVDDFYPLVHKRKIITGSYSTQMAADKGSRTRRILPEVPREKDVTSVSLKMSKSDIKFDDK